MAWCAFAVDVRHVAVLNTRRIALYITLRRYRSANATAARSSDDRHHRHLGALARLVTAAAPATSVELSATRRQARCRCVASPRGQSRGIRAEHEAEHPDRLWGVADDVWVVDTETSEIRTLTGLAATDIDWAPDGSQLYIAGEDGIRVYSMADGRSRVLPGTAGTTTLAVSPGGQTLAVERGTFDAGGRHEGATGRLGVAECHDLAFRGDAMSEEGG